MKAKRVRKRRRGISVAARKAKARKLQKWVCQKVSDLTGYPWGSAGSDMPIESRAMGNSGCDVRLERAVRRVFPYSVECKSRETKLGALPQFVQQAKENQMPRTDWLLVVHNKRKRVKSGKCVGGDTIVILDAGVFFGILEVLRGAHKSRKSQEDQRD